MTIQRATPREHTDNYLPLSNGDSDVANQGSEELVTYGSDDAMIINENCSNGSAYVSPSTVNRVQDDNTVNAPQGESEAETLQCRGDHQITTKDSNYYQQQLKLRDDKIIELERILYEQQQLQSRDEKICVLESKVHEMRQDIHTLLAHMKDQRMSGFHMPVLNSNTNNSLNSIPNEVRNAENF